MGALDYTADDSSDDTADAPDSPLAGVPQGALQKYVDAASDTSGMHSALSQVAQALKADRRQNQIQALFAAAGALGAPTRTGSIGETAANLGKTLGETLGTQNAADRQNAVAAAKLQLDEQKSELAARRALGVQAMKAMSASTQTPAMKMLGKVVLGAPDKDGRQQAYRYVADPNNPGQLTYQVVPIETAKSLMAKQAGVAAAPAYMPTESDIGPDGQVHAPVAAPAADDGTLPLRPAEANPLRIVTGTPADLQASHGAEIKAKGVDLSGLDQHAPVILNLENGEVKPAPPEDPVAKYNGLTGSALLEALSPADKAEVQAIHDGRLLAPVTGTRAKEGSRLLALTTAAYPDFDAGIAKAKFATRQAFAPGGKQGMNFASIDTVMNHIDKLAKDASDLDNTDYPAANAVKNALVKGTGHASVTNYDQSQKAVANELMRVFRGSGAGSTKDIADWQKTLDPNLGPKQQADVVSGALKLVTGRLEPLVDQWNKTMGENRSVLSFISPKARTTFMKLDPDYQLTDDDKAYLASQELAKRKTGTLVAPPAAVARVAGTTPVVTQAPAASAPTANQPTAGQPTAALPPGVTPDTAIAQARSAVKSGKDSRAVALRLRAMGVDSNRVNAFENWAARQ